ncbi:Lipid/polyisoprenoid-binding, YceI-like protein [Russula earlei]|uniref:Lipid/polyisoprenoid-binding, YceI-like protein n=1 Tax=Russula earlei TaxID=71964 RepID=A0ACC0TU49_9AGAM|nr:Lipid/polyisoprenoid-binding, YceI-like protein [Russula earlei]
MKKAFLVAVAFVAFTAVHAQKIYATKSAQVKFFSSTKAEDIEATNSQAESKLSDKGQLMFSLLIKGFRFENELMQEHFNEKDYMNSDQYPKSEFKGAITNIATVNFAKNGSYPVVAEGNLTIRGVTQKVTAKGTLTVANGKVSTKSVFKIKAKDFGFTGKLITGTISEELEITVTAKYD